MRAGQALTQLVEFADGPPDANIDWQLLDGRGQPVATGSVVPPADAASAVVIVSAAQNAIEVGVLASPRELNWSYTVGGLIKSGRLRYRLEAFLPLGVSEDGVRRKLGLEPHELEDEGIDLVAAYGLFESQVSKELLDAVEGRTALVACDAIEALAALDILPRLQVKLAQKESSGTDQYQRQAKIDWSALTEKLEQIVAIGYAEVNSKFDPTTNFAPLLIAVVRSPDPVTNQ